jgi:hypothetical protein
MIANSPLTLERLPATLRAGSEDRILLISIRACSLRFSRRYQAANSLSLSMGHPHRFQPSERGQSLVQVRILPFERVYVTHTRLIDQLLQSPAILNRRANLRHQSLRDVD